MTNGVLMFALNGQAFDSNKNKIDIDYVKMASANAKNIKKYMKNNTVALVTDKKGKEQIVQSQSSANYFDHIIVVYHLDCGHKIQFFLLYLNYNLLKIYLVVKQDFPLIV